MTSAEKFLSMLIALVAFAAVIAVILFLARTFGERNGGRGTAWAFMAPVVLLLSVGLVFPALMTVYQSFLDARGDNFVGLANYATIFTSPDQLTVLRNTVLWVVLTPFVSTAIGLIYALLVNGARLEAPAKALIFLPMAISFVGAAIIWKFVYEFRPLQGNVQQIGLVNQIIVWLGGEPVQLLIESPLNTVLLIVILIWIQAGFAMTVLSAAIKAIPDEIIEAARLDGVGVVQMFRFVTLPTIRPAVVVVLTTIGIATLKIFDIVQVMTGGQFNTSVIANEFYSQTFRSDNQGLGAALAVLLFLLVIPIVAYNVRHLRSSEAR
ncbi:alpha-glucoside transport system permease protein [Kineococcus xinjiangensis]|uniref:Alpha-glucoside transport system permease protein n=1 Tax=Kineococcus xinjiangensis TaxID=512762 RepID=A0A2S6IKF0_9ACTN|nr:sugar ABC transporter permease [Kineococcus xinjiangensis]PPK94678.1 alpha-glucoside transport system permease protein [Kineococcus xinjiangensis]